MIKRTQRMKNVCEEAEVTVELLSSDESDELEHEVEQTSFPAIKKETRSSSKQKRKRIKILTPNLAAALDRTKVSDRKAMFVVTETAKSLGCEVDDVTLSRSSIRRERMKHRSRMMDQLKVEFKEHVKLTVHWDGKLLQDLTLKEKVDRLPIIVSGKGISQLLSVPKIPSGTGESQAAVVYAALQDWGIDDKVGAMCFDTTSVNTGRINGTCILLEQKMNKELLFLACRHHIMELIIRAVFVKSLEFSSSPEVPLFKRFQANWKFIDKEKYDIGIDDADILAQVIDIKDDIINLSKMLLEKNTQPRDDYREFLELTLIFLGEIPSRGVRFMAPGAMHHARWMSKVLYSLKIWMFRSQFTITPKERKGLQKICVFVVRVYLKAWMTAPLPQNAPFNDFNLMKSLLNYKNIDEEISRVASEKLGNHLWYLSENLVALSLFDHQVPHCLKKRIVNAMKNVNGTLQPSKRPNIKLETFVDMKFEDFVTKRSALLFERMALPDAFLQVDPEIWEDQESFCKALTIVKSMQVVNDHAERGIALIQEFCGKITFSETQLQYLLQVVEEHRRSYPDCKKQSLAGTDLSNTI